MQNETIWHKCPTPLFPRRTLDGGWTTGHGQTWRRKRGGKWEYQQDDESPDDFTARSSW